MKLLLLTLGSHGDLEPFLAAGQVFRDAGWEVACAAPDQLAPLTLEAGLRHLPLDRRFLDLLDDPATRSLVGGRGSALARTPPPPGSCCGSTA